MEQENCLNTNSVVLKLLTVYNSVCLRKNTSGSGRSASIEGNLGSILRTIGSAQFLSKSKDLLFSIKLPRSNLWSLILFASCVW